MKHRHLGLFLGCFSIIALAALAACGGGSGEEEFALTLTVQSTGGATGAITSAIQSAECDDACEVLLPEGTIVTLQAAAGTDSMFTGWSGACSGTADCTVTMDAAKSVTAAFAPITVAPVTHTLTVATSGEGEVTSAPAGIDCGSTCTHDYEQGTSVVLTAAAADGAMFSGWSGACAAVSAPTCTVTIDADKSITATFVPVNVQPTTYELTVTKSGTGTGMVSSAPTGISCGSTCAHDYDQGTVVTLTATPNGDAIFVGWSGACTGMGTCFVTMSEARAVTATFTLQTYALTIVKDGEGEGTVTSTPSGINCGATCTSLYASGAMVELAAAPVSGSTFAGWSGACSGEGACVVDMTEARTVTATFALATYDVNIAFSGNGFGHAVSMPHDVDCQGDCRATLLQSEGIALTPVATTGSTFMGWSGACSGTSDCVISATDTDVDVGATFALITPLAFNARESLTADGCPFYTTLADVNADTKTDIVYANQQLSYVGVMPGNGDGTFGTFTSYATMDAPFSVATADLNGDDKLDVVAANYYGNSMSVLFGNGDGTFGTAVEYAAGTGPYHATVGLLNGDMYPDIVVANFSSGDVTVYTNDGMGGFSSSSTVTAGSQSTSVAIADINNDFKNDVLVTSRGSHRVYILPGNGDGTFGASTDYAVGTNPYMVVAAQLNPSDRAIDFVTANYGTDNISIVYANGTGGFYGAAHYDAGDGPSSLAVADMNGDGTNDIVVTNTESDTIVVLLQGRGGIIVQAGSTDAGTDPNSLALADLNGDGKTDIVISNQGTGLSAILQP